MFENKYPYTDFHEMNLDWFLAKFKDVVDEWIAMQRKFETLQQAFNDLKDFVINYFNSVDWQELVNKKIDEMVEDGTFAKLLGAHVLKISNNNLVNDYRLITADGNYNAWGDIIKLSNGAWFICYNKSHSHVPAKTDGFIEVVYRISTNNGASWSDEVVLSEIGEGTNGIAYTKDNTILVVTYGKHRRVYRSVDNGISFTFVDIPDTDDYGVAQKPIINDINGKILFFMDKTNTLIPDYAVHYYTSEDDGLNWEKHVLISNATQRIMWEERGICYKGRYLVFGRNEYGNPYALKSEDGEHWEYYDSLLNYARTTPISCVMVNDLLFINYYSRTQGKNCYIVTHFDAIYNKSFTQFSNRVPVVEEFIGYRTQAFNTGYNNMIYDAEMRSLISISYTTNS